MAKYIPPHRRALDNPDTWQGSPRESRLLRDPFVSYFLRQSPVYKKWLSTKAEYGGDPEVDKKFRDSREGQRRSLESPTNELSTLFRDQFKNAMDDVNVQIDMALSERVQNFLDLGCAPGGFSKWVLEHNKEARGIGVTLSSSEHGLPMFISDWSCDENHRYTLLMENLVSLPNGFDAQVQETFPGGRCTLVICGARYRDENTAQTTRKILCRTILDRLELSQLLVAFRFLELGGTLISLASLKLSPQILDTLVFLREHFHTLTPTKGSHLHGTRSTYYLVCRGFKGDDASRIGAIQRIEAALHLCETADYKRRGRLSTHDGNEMEIALKETNFVVRHFESLWQHQIDALEKDLQRLKTGWQRGRGLRRGSYACKW